MPLDSNGVWQYTETDDVSPFSTFMNLGMGSVSAAIAPLVVNSGFKTITNTAGSTVVSGYPCQSIRLGPFIWTWGRWTRTSATATQTWGTLHADIPNPARIVEVGDFNGNVSRVYIDQSGNITTTGTSTSGTTLSFQALYLAPGVA